MNLGHESSFPVADALIAKAIPFVFATGYGRNIEFPERFRHVPVVTKPYTAANLAPVIKDARAAVRKT